MTEDPAPSPEGAAKPQPKSKPRHLPVLLGIAGVIAAVSVVLYGIGGQGGKDSGYKDSGGKKVDGSAQKCSAERGLAASLKPLVHGEVAALGLNPKGEPLPALNFAGPDGAKTNLSAFSGKIVLLNLWATWCVPCRKEMPSLDRLEAALGSKDFQVVTVNIDTAKLEKAKQFFDEVGIKTLGFYADSSADVFQALKQNGKVVGLPTSVLVGRNGCEIGTMSGPAEWDSADAKALIEAAVR